MAGPLQLYYGGTFDPFHLGHLAIARIARDALQVPVHLLPAADPPHRPPPGASAVQRARMLELAIAGEPGMRIDLRELERARRQPGRPSWTVDTLRELRVASAPGQSIAWLIGADSLIGLGDWHESEALLGLTHLVVAERPGSEIEARLPPPLARRLQDAWAAGAEDLLQQPAGRVWRLRQPLHEESASEVRHAIANDEDWRRLVPLPVADYIVAQRLYGYRTQP